MLDDELKSYRKLIGDKEYNKQYIVLYHQSKYQEGRFSGKKYENSPEKIKRLKEKYKNGVSKEIINKMVGIK